MENYKYGIGDAVRVKSHIKPSWDFDEASMGKYCGKEATIVKKLVGRNVQDKYYLLNVDAGMYQWKEDMLEPDFDILGESYDEEFWGEDIYLPEADSMMFLYDLFETTEATGLGKLEGNLHFNYADGELDLMAKLEGDRILTMEIRRS